MRDWGCRMEEEEQPEEVAALSWRWSSYRGQTYQRSWCQSPREVCLRSQGPLEEEPGQQLEDVAGGAPELELAGRGRCRRCSPPLGGRGQQVSGLSSAGSVELA